MTEKAAVNAEDELVKEVDAELAMVDSEEEIAPLGVFQPPVNNFLIS